jgi:hypothetical protein
MSAPSYLDHLSDADLAFMAEAAQPGAAPAELRGRPEEVSALLAEPAVFEALFHPESERLLLRPSPFLAFACVVERAARDLRTTASVAEPVGAGRRVPVFDVHELREFVAAPRLRLFLAELLTSYTHVASGAVWVRQRRRWRRRRFSELDLAALARLLDLVPPAERPGIYRRLGDLALFLSGVFPDYCNRPLTSGAATERLLREAGVAEPADGMLGALPLLERLGESCYREASATAAPRTAALEVLDDVADRFSRARRVLNFITDRHLFATRDRWFSPPS